MSLADTLSEFRRGIALTNSFVSMAYERDQNGNDLFDDVKKDFVISSSFLKMFIYWESFLEDSFAKYLAGELSTAGTPAPGIVTPADKQHAIKILVGTQKYVDWANHEIVRRLAGIYLVDGNPLLTNLSSIASELSDLRTIRNAAAHLSSSTQAQLDALSTRILGRTQRSTTVSGLVMQLHPGDASKTVLQYYQDMLDICADNIAANRV
ncbi:hypothetical protein LPB260_24325 [Pseudomonas sp. LPB0260]|uniref:hypothetical protein n=1 Tax=Pseudomonas sp. LPB0260 TaxID=2614442 RepID=UPI0015C23242|nr:hypothetical protein [Pseudomonas sp. LPB0260]QLC73837.1 hypothetical protein LPB260_09375 [Pseudomonas sp. LPB0260]QLC76611.1 hypothetical protein LPB260_24325 [Pseudomonas sp. LPB0260]